MVKLVSFRLPHQGNLVKYRGKGTHGGDSVVTLKRIAELCGVSRGTVDRALNGRGRVNPETAAAIREMAEKLGYEPNPAGKALAARKNKLVVGVVVSSEGNPFFDEVLRGMEDAAKEYKIYGFQVVYHRMKGYSVAKQLNLLEDIQEKINALVINPINDSLIAKKLNEMVDTGIFVVTVNNDLEGTKRHSYVGSDYFNGGVTACALLQALIGDAAQIGIALGDRHVFGHALRLQGFQYRMQNVPNFQIVDILEHEDDDFIAYDLTRQFLGNHSEVNAIASLAAGVYGICRAVMQLPVEKRPVVIAFDSVPTTVEMMEQGIIKATIYQHPYRQGRLALDLAFNYLVKGHVPDSRSYILKNEIKLIENL